MKGEAERIREHVDLAIGEIEAGFAEAWPNDQVKDIDEPGWMRFACALDHLRDIKREGTT